jgi:hypothetical protein
MDGRSLMREIMRDDRRNRMMMMQVATWLRTDCGLTYLAKMLIKAYTTSDRDLFEEFKEKLIRTIGKGNDFNAPWIAKIDDLNLPKVYRQLSLFDLDRDLS